MKLLIYIAYSLPCIALVAIGTAVGIVIGLVWCGFTAACEFAADLVETKGFKETMTEKP